MIMNITSSTIDLDRLRAEGEWCTLIIGAVTVAMFLDFVVGVMKARKRGEATTSNGFKRTAAKAGKYYTPLLCAICFDLLLSPVSIYPLFTGLVGLFEILTEFKSIMENTHTKKEIRAAENTMNVVLKNKDDLAKMLGEVLKEVLTEGKVNEDVD